MKKRISQHSRRLGLAAMALVFISSLVYATTWSNGFEWLGLTRAAAENSAVKTSEQNGIQITPATFETTQPIEVKSLSLSTLGGPTRGIYPNTMIDLGDNTVVTPDAVPTGTTRINVSTNTNFKGTFAASPTTGVVRVTNAHPAGTYTVTVRAFDGSGGMTSRTFTLTVANQTVCSNPVGFTNGADVITTTNSSPVDVAVGDFNNDGNQDFAVTNFNTNNVSVRLGDGLGGFSGTTNVSVGNGPGGNSSGNPFGLAIGDFNSDGNQDLAAANTFSNPQAVLYPFV